MAQVAVPGRRQRVFLYCRFGQQLNRQGRWWGTLMRHFLLSGPVSTLTFSVGAATAMCVLIATTGRSYRLVACLQRTSSGAVAVAAITVAAYKHGSAATGAQVASSGDIHWQSGPMERVDGDVRFVKYYAGNVAAVGAAGRGIGTGLAVGTGVAPAFPPASWLSTPSPMLALPSRRPSWLFVHQLQLTLTRPFWRSLASDPCRASLARRWIALRSIRRKPSGQQTAKPAYSRPKIKKQIHTQLALACHTQNSSPPGS
jgi:hypothetical protein